MTQLDSRLVRQLCTMSGRTATWKQPVHSTFVLTVNDQVGRLPSDQDSPMRARTGYKSLKCGEAPFSSVREEFGPHRNPGDLSAQPRTQTFTYDVTLPLPLPGRSPSAPMARVDMYGIVIDPSKRSVPGFAVSGDGGVDP